MDTLTQTRFIPIVSRQIKNKTKNSWYTREKGELKALMTF